MGFDLKGLKENDNRSTFVPFEFFVVDWPFCLLEPKLRAYEEVDSMS